MAIRVCELELTRGTSRSTASTAMPARIFWCATRGRPVGWVRLPASRDRFATSRPSASARRDHRPARLGALALAIRQCRAACAETAPARRCPDERHHVYARPRGTVADLSAKRCWRRTTRTIEVSSSTTPRAPSDTPAGGQSAGALRAREYSGPRLGPQSRHQPKPRADRGIRRRRRASGSSLARGHRGRAFATSDAAAVTGLVAPAELETLARSSLSWSYGGMGHGFIRRIFRKAGPLRGSVCCGRAVSASGRIWLFVASYSPQSAVRYGARRRYAEPRMR